MNSQKKKKKFTDINNVIIIAVQQNVKHKRTIKE